MTPYTPDELLTISYSGSSRILSTATHMHLMYYRQEGLPDTLKSDLRDGIKAIVIAFTIDHARYHRRTFRQSVNKGSQIDELRSLIDYITLQFNTHIGIEAAHTYRNNGYGKDEKICQELWTYVSMAMVPIVTSGHYHPSVKWNPDYQTLQPTEK